LLRDTENIELTIVVLVSSILFRYLMEISDRLSDALHLHLLLGQAH